jgi:hypothetical protein
LRLAHAAVTLDGAGRFAPAGRPTEGAAEYKPLAAAAVLSAINPQENISRTTSHVFDAYTALVDAL